MIAIRRIQRSRLPGARWAPEKSYSEGKSLEKAGGDKKTLTVAVKPPSSLISCLQDGKKSIKVALLASNNKMGLAAALTMKAKGRYVRELSLWDVNSSLRGEVLDLNHIPTSTKVYAYVGEGQLGHALRDADVVVVMGGTCGGKGASSADLFYANSEAVREMARSVILAAPRALVAIAVQPVTSVVSFFGEIQKSVGAFSPNRLVGLMTLEEMRARSLVSMFLSVPPGVVDVKLAGGSTPETLVPILEGGPVGECLGNDSALLTRMVRTYTEAVRKAGSEGPDLADGHAVANFVISAAESLVLGKRLTLSALVVTNALPGVPYLTAPVTFGPEGAETIPALPKLSEREFKLLIEAIPILREDIATGEAWAHSKRRRPLSLSCN